MENKKILLVEDELEIASLISLHLGDLGAKVTHASDGHKGMSLACSDQLWELIILDIQLPGPSGLDICRAIRRKNPLVPILLLTSRTAELDRVLGLEVGADDYVSKPFSMMELIARAKAVFRRTSAMTSTKTQDKAIKIGELKIIENERKVLLAGKPIELTAREFSLLLHFASHPGRVFSRSELLDSVWGYNHEGYEHAVNSTINRLRSKLEKDSRNPNYIMTCWGVGYKLNADPSS